MPKRDDLASLARRIRRAQATAREEPRPANYQSSRARREAAAAELAEIALAERAGQLMEATAVRATLASISGMLRGRLELMVDRLVADISAVRGEETAIAAALARGIHRELIYITDALARGSTAD